LFGSMTKVVDEARPFSNVSIGKIFVLDVRNSFFYSKRGAKKKGLVNQTYVGFSP
jgi:hypothetical protein